MQVPARLAFRLAGRVRGRHVTRAAATRRLVATLSYAPGDGLDARGPPQTPSLVFATQRVQAVPGAPAEAWRRVPWERGASPLSQERAVHPGCLRPPSPGVAGASGSQGHRRATRRQESGYWRPRVGH